MAVRYAQAPTASSGPTPYSAVSAHTAPRNHLAKNTPAGGTAPVPRGQAPQIACAKGAQLDPAPSQRAHPLQPAVARNRRLRAGGMALISSPVKTCSVFMWLSTTA